MPRKAILFYGAFLYTVSKTTAVSFTDIKIIFLQTFNSSGSITNLQEFYLEFPENYILYWNPK